MAKKIFSDSGGVAQLGVNLVERTVLRSGHRWRPIELHDVGIDGEIELRDPRTAAALHRLVRVQIKTRASFTRDRACCFEFACDQKDVDYWQRSPVPVVLIFVHEPSERAYFKCVTEWFADPTHRATRRVVFDKKRDRFDETVGPQLVRLTGGPASAAIVPAPSKPEELVSNLLPVVQVPEHIWSAPTECKTPEDAHLRFEEVGQGRASDYLLREGRLYALRNPQGNPLEHLCEGPVERFPASDWARSDDPNRMHRYAELLRRTLLQQLKGEGLGWQPDRRLFYFRAPQDPLGNRFIAGARKQPRQVVWVERFIGDDGQERVSYVRHHAFAPRFLRLDGRWYLSVEPTYYYSWDGERENRRADELATGMKRLERNAAVLGSLRMWERLLTRPPSLLSGQPPLLVFGPAETVEVDRLLDDKVWNRVYREKDAGTLRGQQEFAA